MRQRIVAETLEVTCLASRECWRATMEHDATRARQAEEVARTMAGRLREECAKLRADYPEGPPFALFR